ncbi:glycosyltransferase family 39 protein [Pyrococcus kukulkanii]|uniref:ArnT family glycosyltransferase n=1 Tax=Pyrococcus kukulkanii TaxID=1609559 RepID=UPI00356361E5
MMYRPPLYPHTLSLLYHFIHDPLAQLKVARIVSAFFFALTASLVYLLCLELFGDLIKGVIASLFFMFNGLALTMGGRELVHSEFTFFYTLAIYFLYTGRKRGEPRRIYLAFISAGLAVLTRYTGLSVIPVFLAYLWLTDYWGRVKKKEYWIGFMLFFLVLLPWLYLGHLHYGGYFRPFKIANRVVTLDKPVSVSDFLKLLFNDIGIVLPALAVLGFLKQRQYEKGYLLIGWSFIGFIMIMMVTHKETKFITFLSPVIGILAAEGIELIGKTIEIVIARVRIKNIKPWLITLALAILLIIPIAQKGFDLKERWNSVGVQESHVLKYASEKYPAEKLFVSPYLYTMAGFYYPKAEVEMILRRKSIEEKIARGYYDVIIHKNPNVYLNILTSGKYVKVEEFYGGRLEIFVRR